jgi:recombination protein RecA
MARKPATNSIDDDLSLLKEQMEKTFGEGSAMSLDAPEALSNIEHWVSTRSMIVDKVLAGGRTLPCPLMPFGRQVEIAGLPGAGKTTLCAQIAAEVQSKGGLVIVTDTEERVDHTYWTSLGVDCSKVLNLHGASIEDVFRKQMKAIEIMSGNAPDRLMLMIWDSVGGTATETIKESEDPMGGEAMLKDVRVIGHGMKVINQMLPKSKVCYLYTNHLYRKVGQTYGDPWETPGGQKLKYFATVRLRLTNIGQIKEKDAHGNDQQVGHKVAVNAEKNSMAPMRRELTGALIGGSGFSNDYTVMETAVSMKLISKSGAWSTWTTPSGEEVKYQGWNGFLEKVVTHVEYPVLEDQVFQAL